MSDARQETALLKQQVAELTKQKDTGDARRWGVIVVFLSGLLSLATALVVALVRK